MSNRPISPVTMILVDGQERKFLLTLGGMKRIKEKLGIKQFSDVATLDFVDSWPVMLWEALLDRGDLTEAQFADLVPADATALSRIVSALIGASMPEENPTNPPETAAEK